MSTFPEVRRTHITRNQLFMALFSGLALLVVLAWPGIGSFAVIEPSEGLSSDEAILGFLAIGLALSLLAALRHEWRTNDHERRYYRRPAEYRHPQKAEERAAEALQFLKTRPFSETQVQYRLFFDIDAAESSGHFYFNPRLSHPCTRRKRK